MRWLLCGDDGSKKTKTTSVITEKYPARQCNSITVLNKIFGKKQLSYSHYSLILIRKKFKSAPRQICNYFGRDGFAVACRGLQAPRARIVDHADNKTRSIALESRTTLMSTCRDCWNCRVSHWTPYTTCSRGPARGFCGDADWIVAALVPIMEAFRMQLTSGRFRQRSGRMDVWTSQS